MLNRLSNKKKESMFQVKDSSSEPEVVSLKKGPNSKCHLSRSSTDADWPTKLLQYFVINSVPRSIVVAWPAECFQHFLFLLSMLVIG